MNSENNIKKWINNNFSKLKLKSKKTFENMQLTTEKNSRVFFGLAKRIDTEDIINEAVSEASEKVTKKKSKGKKIFNVCFFIFNIILIVAVFYNFAHEQGGIQPLSTLFANAPNWTMLLMALLMYIIANLCNSMKFSFLIYSKTKKFKPWFSFKVATIGRYYDHITPLGSGGQPFEIYYLKKNGYSGDVSTAIPLAKYMVWQVAFVLLNLFILIAYSKNYISSPLVKVMAWVGLGVLLFLFLFVFLMSVTKRWCASLVVGVLKLLHKMKIIKNYRAVLEKVLRFVKSYQYSIKSFAKNPMTVISTLLVTLGSILANALVAYFIYIAFVSNPTVSWWEIVCKCCICELAVCLVPLPGGSGATELSFNALLGAMFPDGTLFWGILIWRILTYYLYILQGVGVLVWDIFADRKNKHKFIEKNMNEVKNN